MKSKTKFVCSECGYETRKWLGRCPSCLQWNTFLEEPESETKGNSVERALPKAIPLTEISWETERRITTGMQELDRVLGGGIVDGSLVLVGGDPGIGKSTLLLQVCGVLSRNSGMKILYVSGEESVKQIKIRAERLSVNSENILMVTETCFENISKLIEEINPHVVILDSIQTVYSELLSSAPGSVSQVREVTGQLMRIAKGRGVTVFIVGHVTKEGAIAGPRVLEHMVDTVLYFEGERHQNYRILRAVKNRFGSTNEIGLFEMTQYGLKEVNNPSGLFLDSRAKDQPGSVIVASLEGTRPMLLEIQALVTPTVFGIARRMATGIDYNRMTMLMAVLEKRIGMPLYNHDAYVNVVGGIHIDEPACDLGVVASIAGSFKNQPVDPDIVVVGEVGLTGEVRPVNQADKRIMEAKRLGFRKCLVPSGNKSSALENIDGIEIIFAGTVEEALAYLF
ncbi:DNA repair protein RadA [Thermoclostridium stercorarium subsp. stercorarium DSM 8532]|uniref:DNA repair protein RadA n=3 Tax=Thermoclostridium stercorarium TaxID=1510 RepID=L7VKV3_THES1|nr:DNA repair protein RadA [Thermoclostridium stercorarium]AGC67294.1 DNA repair protein RadA [Thermoclostridium stercorarium subsp. stercorarium DSM 8532]AGI38359.1 RadA [Thermoclostridium stercorarium subsp. stercorarium DSM 8532]ANW97796.1 DNA repair protein RadA [Thermoclostridium stercorarium subsp. thermolacticum DSM 2910]ANX00322.1 DNA repair protein RadA [Thermoclostridium stercorarium subsp. leptospartum DSM 9219]